MPEFNPAQVELLLETRSRLQRLLSYAESGMKSSAVSLIKTQLLNTESGNAGFFVGVMNSILGTPLYKNLQDCLDALLTMRGNPSPRLFGKDGLYPDLPLHEQWQKSIAVLKGTITSLASLQSAAESGDVSGTELPQEWCEVILWLKNRYCENDAGSLRIFRESEAAAAFPTVLNLEALWSLLESHGTIGQKRFGHFAIELPDTDTAMNQSILPVADDIREIKPSLWSFAKGAVRSMRQIIPASKENAAWNVSRLLADVLGWATYPDPNRLSLDWWDTYKANVESAVNAAVRSFDDDKNTLQQLRDVRSLILKFLGLMYHNPTLSRIPVQDWPVKAYHRLFDDLSELEREFRTRGNTEPRSHQSALATGNTKSPATRPTSVTPVSSAAQPDAEGSHIAPNFNGSWKHVYAFLWQQGFDLSQSQDDYKAVFETYQSEFGKKTTGSGKRKRATYKMPGDCDAKSIRQGYRRQLQRHLARR